MCVCVSFPLYHPFEASVYLAEGQSAADFDLHVKVV